jgi:hypothetical protein
MWQMFDNIFGLPQTTDGDLFFLQFLASSPSEKVASGSVLL